MKPKLVLSALTVVWVLFIIFEWFASVIRFLFSRKMNTAVKAASGFVHHVRTAFMVVLAISNIMLFMRHVDDSGR